MAQVQPTARPARNLAVDFYRFSGVVLIVLGHWLAGSVTYHDGQFGRQNPLVDMPWTQWLTWPFQAVPAFFLVAGYAGAVSWGHHRDTQDMSRQTWLRRRLARVLGPTAVYATLVSAVVVFLRVRHLAGSVLEYAGWAVAMHLWFLAVYVLVVSLTPSAIAAHRRWGLLVPAALAVGVAVVDAASLAGHIPYLGWLNYLLCWGGLYQLGIAWQGGLLVGRRPVLLAFGSGLTLALLIWLGPYPVSMIGVPGQNVDNTTPPTAAALAFGCAQAGLAMALAPALNRVLRAGLLPARAGGGQCQRDGPVSVAHDSCRDRGARRLPGRPVAATGRRNRAVVAGPTGMAGRPRLSDSGRDDAVVVGAAPFAAPLPMIGVPVTERWAEPVMLVGAAMTAYGLAFVAVNGFAPDGHYPWVAGLVFAAGALLVALRPAELTRQKAGAAPTRGG